MTHDGSSGLVSGFCAGGAGLAGVCAPGVVPSHNRAAGINTTGRQDRTCMSAIIPGFVPVGGTSPAPSSPSPRVADDRAKALEHRFVLLETLADFVVGDPRVGI